jgi:GNAT superfamily N-acetyltransferase
VTSKFIVLKTHAELESVFPLMHELRPHLSLSEYLTVYDEAHKADKFEIVALKENEVIVALMGYRILHDLVRGKHVYIDDLVVSKDVRSKGYGAQLLSYAESVARELKCPLRLCTGLDNSRGMKFYERNGWTQRVVVYVKKL